MWGHLWGVPCPWGEAGAHRAVHSSHTTPQLSTSPFNVTPQKDKDPFRRPAPRWPHRYLVVLGGWLCPPGAEHPQRSFPKQPCGSSWGHCSARLRPSLGTWVPVSGWVWHGETWPPAPRPQQGCHRGAARAQGAAGSPQHGGCHTVLGLAGWALSSLAWHRIRPLSGNALGSVPVTPSVLARGPGIVPGDAAEQRVLALPGGAGELEGERQRRDRSTWGKGCWAGAQGGGDGPCTLFPAGGSPGSWLCGGFGAGRALGGP